MESGPTAARSLVVSDLVRDSKLVTKFTGQCTQHVRYRSEEHRKVKHQEQWVRRRHLGGGAFGTIWLETLESLNGRAIPDEEKQLRAVKDIKKDVHGSVANYYNRELEATAKFSQERVSNISRSFSFCKTFSS